MEKLNRRQARENAFILLFESSFGRELDELMESCRDDKEEFHIDSFSEQLLREYYLHQEEVDKTITARLKGWTMDRLPRVSLALLRLAVTEMQYGEQDMDSVVINEIVELAKKYGDEKDYQFINGVLGNISRDKAAPQEGSALQAEPQDLKTEE